MNGRLALRLLGLGMALVLALEVLIRIAEALSGHTSSSPLAAFPIAPRSGAAARRTLAPGSTVRFAERQGDIGYRANALGTRGGGPVPAARRIVVLGDSIAFGLGVREDETFPALLGGPLEGAVLNLAIPGYDLLDSAEALRQDGLPWRPTDVVVQVTHNDLGFRSRAAEKAGPPAGLRSLAVRGLHASALGRRARQALAAVWGRLPGDPPRWPDDRARAYLDAWRSSEETERAFGVLESLLTDARAAGARVVLVWVPLEAEALDGRSDPVAPRLAEVARRTGAIFLDATEVLHPPQRSLTFDGLHPTPDGQRALSARIQAALM
jgi:lysophospholipase L1-like esterase